jgi:DNA-binding NarL/FixJ family response regulator
VSRTIRIVLCDDHQLVRTGLRRIIEVETDLEVVGEAASCDEALNLTVRARPDVLVLDVGLPDGSGLDALERVRAAVPDTRVLMLTVHDEVAYLRRAFATGASGYLVKDAADTELITAIRAVAAGREHLQPALGAALLAPDAAEVALTGPGGTLTERETEVLRLIALGLTNAQIAESIFVSVRTVETHRAHIQQKLDVRGRAALVARAHEHGLLEDDPAVASGRGG